MLQYSSNGVAIHITYEELDGLRDKLRAMMDVYSDQYRGDWFDGDDYAIDVANWLARKLGIQVVERP